MIETTQGTRFAWSKRTGSSWRLAALIFGMLFLHSAAFFLFQAATPRISPPPRMAPPIQVVTAVGSDGRDSEENQALLRWIEAEDPALVARIPNVTLPDPVAIAYRPSYTTMRTAPLELPAEPATVQFPSPRDPTSIIRSGMPETSPLNGRMPRQATRIRLSSEIAARAPKDLEFRPRSVSAKLIEPSHFIVGIAPDGTVRFVFPQKQESGSIPELDREAAAFLNSLSFSPTDGTKETWGQAIVEWGDETAATP